MYTQAWDETQPPGTALANTLDTIIQNDKRDTRERVAGIFGLNLAQWTADPIVPISLTLSGALTAASLIGALLGNVTGNLTGTVLTPAQANITSLGTLTGLTVSGITTLNGTAGNTIVKGTSGDSNIQLLGAPASGHFNWLISKSWTIANSLQFVPSTAADGNTFTTAVLSLDRNGVLSTTSYSGTLLTASQPNITGLGSILNLTSSGTVALQNTTQTTGPVYLQLSNTSGFILIGAESSTGGAFWAGTSPYSTVLGNSAARSIHFITNNVVRQTIDSAGNVAFSGTVTAANFVGPTSIDAGVLTGATLAANVLHSNLQDLGVLTSLVVSGQPVIGNNSAPSLAQALFGTSSVVGSIGTATSSGGMSMAYNAKQTGANGSGTDSWTQNFAALGSALLQVNVNTIDFYTSPAGQGAAAFATFWTPRASITTTGFVGNLTGTILTAAQGNITSVGILTSLSVGGNAVISHNATPQLAITSTGSTVTLQLAADNTAGYIGTTTAHPLIIRANGAEGGRVDTTLRFLWGTTVTSGVAAGGIHVAGASVFDSSVSVAGLFRGNNGSGIAASGGDYPYFGHNFVSTGVAGTYNYFVTDFSAAIQFIAGGISFKTAPSGVAGNPITFTERLLIAQSGAITANGAWTFNSTISGVTTLTATTIAGTLSTAAQGNITSVGTLTALTISGAFTFTAAASKIIPGVTSISLRNNADSADNLIITNAGAVTFRSTVSGITTLTATTFSGALSGNVTGNLTGNVTGTILTAAQANITSLGTLSALGVGGDITLSGGGRLIGVGKSSLGNALGAQITLAKVSTVAPPVANAAQQAWLKIVGDDAVTYQVPAFT